MNVITAGGLSALLLEGLKWAYRRYIKDPEFNFNPNFYFVALPVMNILVIPLMFLLGVDGVELPADWVEFARSSLQVLVGSFISVFAYNGAIAPLKEYNRVYNGYA
ncbi:hypothetical protein LCGC14_1499610 [marine sediment metagenome]|uniref:Uncharacterized protein n=1 Tax=marine sediment metagenome TaxID=412755 RepID=A0A0F9JQB9_9ZZZZ